MGLLKTVASKLETLGGDLMSRPLTTTKDVLARRAEQRGLRMADDLKMVFESIAADREAAGLHETDSKIYEGQFLSLGTRHVTLTRDQPLGMRGDVEWITVGQNGIEVGAESDLEKIESLCTYEPDNLRHRGLARACLRAIHATTVY